MISVRELIARAIKVLHPTIEHSIFQIRSHLRILNAEPRPVTHQGKALPLAFDAHPITSELKVVGLGYLFSP